MTKKTWDERSGGERIAIITATLSVILAVNFAVWSILVILVIAIAKAVL